MSDFETLQKAARGGEAVVYPLDRYMATRLLEVVKLSEALLRDVFTRWPLEPSSMTETESRLFAAIEDVKA